MPHRIWDDLRLRLGVAGFAALSAGLAPPKPKAFVLVEVGAAGVGVPVPVGAVGPPNKPPAVGPLALVLLGPLAPEPKMPPPAVVGFGNPKGDPDPT